MPMIRLTVSTEISSNLPVMDKVIVAALIFKLCLQKALQLLTGADYLQVTRIQPMRCRLRSAVCLHGQPDT